MPLKKFEVYNEDFALTVVGYLALWNSVTELLSL